MSFNFGSGDGAVHLHRIIPRLFYTRTVNGDGLQNGSSLPRVSGEAFYGRGSKLYEESSSLCNEEEESSGGHVEKKRRLSVEQVRLLEMSFAVESKLEAERKMQLAAELGLQPRQVAVWFQNRRVRCKSKQLEREYKQLKQIYNAKLSEEEKLRAEVARLTQELKEARKCQPRDGEKPTATLISITPQNEKNTGGEEETQIFSYSNAEEELQQIMSPASFCSHSDSNRRQLNNRENRDELQSLPYPKKYCDDLYYDDHQWLTFSSHVES